MVYVNKITRGRSIERSSQRALLSTLLTVARSFPRSLPPPPPPKRSQTEQNTNQTRSNKKRIQDRPHRSNERPDRSSNTIQTRDHILEQQRTASETKRQKTNAPKGISHHRAVGWAWNEPKGERDGGGWSDKGQLDIWDIGRTDERSGS